jgi:hypothetical protein
LEPETAADVFDSFQRNFEMTGNHNDMIASADMDMLLKDVCGKLLTRVEKSKLYTHFGIGEKQKKDGGRNIKYRTGLKRIKYCYRCSKPTNSGDEHCTCTQTSISRFI